MSIIKHIHSYPEPLITATASEYSSDVTAVILAGGNSTRMKSNKALLPFAGERFIERIFRQLSAIFVEIILVTNNPELYRFIPCRKVPDIYPGMGALAGIHAGLSSSRTSHIFAVACDMPHLNQAVIRHLVSRVSGQDVIIPESDGGLEPLHAVYGRGAIPVIEEQLSKGKRKIVACCQRLKTTVITREEIGSLDPQFLSFRNINTPEEYYRFREDIQSIVKSEQIDAGRVTPGHCVPTLDLSRLVKEQ
jgi:molybdopterin-guanine dinucleotide biosynthesis protein A